MAKELGLQFKNNEPVFEVTEMVNQETVNNDPRVLDKVIDGAKDTANLFVDETKEIAPSATNFFKRSTERLDSKERVISFIPNSVLFYGAVIVTALYVAKKL